MCFPSSRTTFMLFLLSIFGYGNALQLLSSISEEERNANILKTTHYPGEGYRENQTALMSVSYTKQETYRAEWWWLTTTVGFPRSNVIRSKLPPTTEFRFSNSTDGTITETVKVETSVVNSGLYIFQIVDPAVETSETIARVHYILEIAVAPNGVTAERISDHGNQFKSLQFDHIYNFDCSAWGYPHPKMTWEMSSCTTANLPVNRTCEDVWKSVEPGGKLFQLDSANHRRERVSLNANRIGKFRCIAENSVGRQLSNEIVLTPSEEVASVEKAETHLTTEYDGGVYRQNQTASIFICYNKPQHFLSDWTWVTSAMIALRLGSTNWVRPALVKSKLPNAIERVISNSSCSNVTETIRIAATLANSGIYTFRIIDPSTRDTIKYANFIVVSTAAPNEIEVEQISGDMFGCTATGYPQPNLHWEINFCTDETKNFPEPCDDDWKPTVSKGRQLRVESAYRSVERADITIDREGKMRCVAENSEGRQTSEEKLVFPSTADFSYIMDRIMRNLLMLLSLRNKLQEQVVVYREDQFELRCPMRTVLRPGDRQPVVEWIKYLSNGTNLKLADQNGSDGNYYALDQRHQLGYENFTEDTIIYLLTLHNISTTETGVYACTESARLVNITVVDAFPPVISGIDEHIEFESPSKLSLQCIADGGPKPTTVWYQHGNVLNAGRNSSISIKPNSLEFLHIDGSDAGEYVCEATNRVGKARRSFHLTQKIPRVP